MQKLIQRAALAAVCAIQMPTAATAASDGTIGTDSTGTVQIDAVVPNRVQISGLADIDFGTVDPSTDASEPQSLCVWSNTPGRKYNVTATGDGGGGTAFSLSDGTNDLPYTVEWAATSGATSGTSLTSGTALTGQSSAAVNPSCSSGASNSASLIVNMASTDLLAAIASSYTGTLTLVVAPE